MSAERAPLERSAGPHPAAMIERPGAVLRWFFRSFFRPIEFPMAFAERIRAAAARGTVVYVCRTLSTIDYLYFSYAFLEHGLPLARFANGEGTLLWQGLGKIFASVWAWLWHRRREAPVEQLADVVRRGESALIFLERPRTLFGREPPGFRGPFFEELIRLVHEGRAGPPIIFVPLLLLWGDPAVRALKARRSLIDVVFGDLEAPGRVRSIWNFFNHYKESQVLVGEPLELAAFLDEQSGDAAEEVLARRLRWRLGGRLESEVRVVLGPPRKGARRLLKEVLRSRKLIAEAQALATAEQISPAAMDKRLRATLREIAADPKPWVFQLLRPLLAWAWRRIYEGVEVDGPGLERVREAARRGPLVLVPSHKSHIDYLILSWVFAEHDLVPPHVAAGANLAFWPLGFFFRRAGAFFLRRSFKGDRLYRAVFLAYVRKLLREGHNLEFFIEGGRSRSGKLLAPKLGLLGMIVEAALDDDGAKARRAQVVPISIGYEKVVEERSYARERAGGEKRAESVKGLLGATRVLRRSYGRLNIQFDEPFPLGATLRDLGALAAWDEQENLVVPAEENLRRHATLRLAHRIVYGINRVTALTPTALTASALLATGRRGIERRALLAHAAFLLERARVTEGRLSVSLTDAQGALSVEAIDRSLELLERDGDVQLRRAPAGASDRGRDGASSSLDDIYLLPDERRARLAYYRNNAIHLYVAEALVALALMGAGDAGLPRLGRATLRQHTLELSRLLKREFSYRVGESFEVIFDQTLGRLLGAGLLVEEAGMIAAAPGAPERLGLLAGQVIDFVESYWVVARALEGLEQPLSERELLRRIHDLGDKLYLTGEIKRAEACVRANYQNAVEYFQESGLLTTIDRKLALAPGAMPRAIAHSIAAHLPRQP